MPRPQSSIGALILGLVLASCSTGRQLDSTTLREGMSPDSVEQAWGKPSKVDEYQDDTGLNTRWAYHRQVAREHLYWSLESQRTVHGYATTAVRRGRPYSQSYLAAFAVFQENKLVRWQTFQPPIEEPPWIRQGPDFRSSSPNLIFQ